jgi:hypothetical protein
MINKVFIDTADIQYSPWRAYLVTVTPNPQVKSSAYRPAQWGREIPKTFIEDDVGIIWYFDAVVRADHSQSQRITQHPVQDKANITDHSFSLPAQLSMEIQMSDVMDSFSPGQWSVGDDSDMTKSVFAYQKLVEWKNHGVPLNITTRLDTYENMVIANISSPDDIRTLYGLKCMVTFQQIFVTLISVQTTNLRPHALNTIDKGTIPIASLEGSVLREVESFIFGYK